jgi:hypothetical protein
MCPETDHRHLKPASPQKHHGLRRSREILIGEEQPAAASGSASGTHRDLSSQPVPHRYLAASCGGHSIPALIPHPIHPSIRLLIMTLNGLIRRCGCQTARASEGQGSGSSPSPGSHPLGRVALRSVPAPNVSAGQRVCIGAPHSRSGLAVSERLRWAKQNRNEPSAHSTPILQAHLSMRKWYETVDLIAAGRKHISVR